jgi:hypothetical protein
MKGGRLVLTYYRVGGGPRLAGMRVVSCSTSEMDM